MKDFTSLESDDKLKFVQREFKLKHDIHDFMIDEQVIFEYNHDLNEFKLTIPSEIYQAYGLDFIVKKVNKILSKIDDKIKLTSRGNNFYLDTVKNLIEFHLDTQLHYKINS